MSPMPTPVPPSVQPPPEAFNFAQHLLALNAGRAERPAYIDDAGTLTYGQLAERRGGWPPVCARWASSARNGCCC